MERSVAPSLDLEVSTVSRQKSTVRRSPAAVFVIDQEKIRRSGARNVPELLRMVPGVQVARIDVNKYAITIRGFNGRFTNKLLVQIDGRSVYTPLFGGVYWDVQDVLLADIERIEIIRGPGATVWGANAVNGVINIITKNTRDTVGVYANGGGGDQEGAFTAARVGGHVNEDLHYRVYGKYFDRPEGFNATGPAVDIWRQGRGGFRMDYTPNCFDEVTVQGDIYQGYSGGAQVLPAPAFPFVNPVQNRSFVRGANALTRWTRTLSDESDFAVQMYYDRTERDSATGSEDRDVFDVDFQHRFPIGCAHKMIWGGRYRSSKDLFRAVNPFAITIAPTERTLDTISFFVQDEIELVDDTLFFTVGSKFEENDFTGFEYQPSGRLVWNPTETQSIWGAVSRAIRRPTRVEDDVFLRSLTTTPGVFATLAGHRGVISEELIAYELGYRSQVSEYFSFDIATFYHKYNHAIGVVPVGPPAPPTALLLTNAMDAESYGVEVAINYAINDCWDLYGNYSFLRINSSPSVTSGRLEGGAPRNQAYLMLSGDVGSDVQLDFMLRYVEDLPVFNVPSYVDLNVRLGWWAHENLELSLVGQNLLDSQHLEFVGEAFTGGIGTEVERGVYGMATLNY
ncbi:MAG: TonB-dependent receptor [Pirellulaceae bacterium]|nr:TonB-dependent receptor [Pirellulaceae bacterium]